MKLQWCKCESGNILIKEDIDRTHRPHCESRVAHSAINWQFWFGYPRMTNIIFSLKWLFMFMSPCMLFWDDVTIFWDEALLLFTLLTDKLRKNLTNKKFAYLLSYQILIPKYSNIIPKLHLKIPFRWYEKVLYIEFC